MLKQPGCSFDYLWNLVLKNNVMIAPTPFSPELMMAIFWEESLFNNTAQVGSGTAVGYGQVEPAEFYRFDAKKLNSPSPAMKAMAQSVQAKGYLVHNLPPVAKNGNQTVLNGSLTDEQAVQVAMALVRDLHERGRSKKGILQGYAGVGFTGPQADHLKGDGRQKVIDGWLRCEAKLINANKSDADAVMMALQEAKPFNAWQEFRAVLFPNAAPSSSVPAGLPAAAGSTGAGAGSVMQQVMQKAAQAASKASQQARGVGQQAAGAWAANTATGKCTPQSSYGVAWGKC
jgi:hypothetical protein